MNKTVFVGMSGGVDSSVTAALLREQKYNVIGVHMRCYNVDGCAETDAEDARRAAETLGIPFYVFNFEEVYKQKVVEYMVAGYREGITPNPDVMCNREIKFGIFLKKAREMGADYVATGHYVRLRRKILNKTKTFYQLSAGKDKNKDQSYFLWTLTQEQLKYSLFPIGIYTKPQVRVLAKKFKLLNAEKKDSQGICFLGKVTLADFLKEYIPEKKGAIIMTTGEKIGTHKGVYYYTIGQRKGLGIGGGEPYYIVKKDIKTNTLVVAKGDNDPKLSHKEIDLIDVHIINPEIISLSFAKGGQAHISNNGHIEVMARVRYRQPVSQAMLVRTSNKQQTKGKRALKNSTPHVTLNWSLHFKTPQKFIASGQSAVFYTKTGDMIGGGVIV